MSDFSLAVVFQKYYPEYVRGYADLDKDGKKDSNEEIVDLNHNSQIDEKDLWYFLATKAAAIKQEVFAEMKRQGTKEALQQLTENLSLFKPELWGKVIERLAPEAEEDLIGFLDLPAETRELPPILAPVVTALGKIKSKKAAEKILNLARRINYAYVAVGPEYELLVKSAEALGQINDPQTLEELEKRVSHEPPGVSSTITREVRAKAAIILGYLPPEKAIKILVARLAVEKDNLVKKLIIEALARLRAKEAAPQVIALINSPDSRIQSAVVQFIGEVQQPSLEDDLIALYQRSDNELARKNIIYALGRMKSKKAISLIVASLADLRFVDVAVEALKNIGKPAVPELLKALAHEDKNVRFYAVIILGEFLPDPKIKKAFQARLSLERDEGLRNEIEGQLRRWYPVEKK